MNTRPTSGTKNALRGSANLCFITRSMQRPARDAMCAHPSVPKRRSPARKRNRISLEQDKCIKCGICYEACKFDAIVVNNQKSKGNPMITFKLNGKTVQGEEGQYILQVAQKYGIEIPTLCHHKALEPAGMCRLCTVELFDGRRSRYVTACNYPIWEGMEVRTDTEAVHQGPQTDRGAASGPLSGGPILKETRAKKYGIEEARFKKGGDDCILCGLCTRICERMGNSAISLTGRGHGHEGGHPLSPPDRFCLGLRGLCLGLPHGAHQAGRYFQSTPSNGSLRNTTWGSRGGSPSTFPMPRPSQHPGHRPEQVHPFQDRRVQDLRGILRRGGHRPHPEGRDHRAQRGGRYPCPGFQPFDPSKYETYNYSRLPNVVTSMEFERILSASGPTMGHLVRMSDHKEPKKIAWLQCVGSRDMNRCDHPYCSSVCCMYAIKEAVIAKEHSGG
jgi:heterodisulfide reductase subunit A2